MIITAPSSLRPRGTVYGLASGMAGLLALAGTAFADTASFAAETAFPVTIEHEWGSTTIEHQPTRIVALGWNEADTVLALGVTPVAIQDWQQLGLTDGQVNPWTEDLVQGDGPIVLPRGDLDFRRIASLQPDLILVVNGRDNSSQANYALLSQIAPTIASPTNVENNNLPWQDQVRIDALALGRVEAGAQLIANTTARLEAVRQAHPEFAGRTFTIDWGVQNGWHSYTHGDVRPQQLEDIGLSISPDVRDLPATNYFADLSMEQTGTLEADVVLLVAFARSAAAIIAEPAVQALVAVREHRVILLDNDDEPVLRAAFAVGSPPSIAYTLDQLVPRIADALQGKGDALDGNEVR